MDLSSCKIQFIHFLSFVYFKAGNLAHASTQTWHEKNNIQ